MDSTVRARAQARVCVVRRTFPIGLALIGAIILVVEIGAPYALHVFGAAHFANGTMTLRTNILLGPAWVIKDHYVSIRRAQHRMARPSSTMSIGTVTEVAGAAIGGVLWGLNGICLGWVVSASCEALLLLPPVLHVYRHAPAIHSEVRDESD